jgi:hypothetical protein
MVGGEPLFPIHDEVNFRVQTDWLMGYLGTKRPEKTNVTSYTIP